MTYLIKSFIFSAIKSQEFAELKNITFTQNYARIDNPLEKEGFILLPPINPLLVEKFIGLNIDGSLISIAIRSRNKWITIANKTWEDCDQPQFYSLETIQDNLHLIKSNKIQICLKLINDSYIKELWISYVVPIEILNYVLKYSLPIKLSQPIEMNHQINNEVSSNQLSLPKGFDPLRMKNISVFKIPENEVIDGRVENRQIILDNEFVGFGILRFNYSLKAEYYPGIYQITESPCVLIRDLENEKYRHLNLEVITQGNTTISWHPGYIYDQPLEIIVIGHYLEEIKLIACKLIGLITKESYLYLPPFDINIPIQAKPNVKQSSTSKLEGDLFEVSFRVTLLNLCVSDYLTYA